MLTRENILSISDKAIKQVEIPEWSGFIYIRGMTIEDVGYFQALADDENSLEKMIIRFVCDSEGNALFTSDDTESLKKKSIQALKRIINEIKAYNSLEDAEKNLESTQG